MPIELIIPIAVIAYWLAQKTGRFITAYIGVRDPADNGQPDIQPDLCRVRLFLFHKAH